MTYPAVTVVIPTHNRPEMMRRAVQSVLEQTYNGQIEIIVVFDASDPVLPQVSLPGNRQLSALPNSRTRGLAGARNTGILAASHALVAFLDDDDSWLAEKLEAQVEVWASYPDVMLIGTAMIVDDGERTHERLLPAEVITHPQLIQNRLAGLHSSSFLFRKSALLGDVGLVDEDLPESYGEDYDLLLRTAGVSEIRVVNRPLVSVRWQGQSYFFGKWAVYADALEYLLAKHPAFLRNPKALSRIRSQIAFARAANGDHHRARRLAVCAIRGNFRNVKAYLALAISLHLVTAGAVIKVVQRFGKGI